MSLMKTLAKVAVGVALAKGAKTMMNNRSSGGTSSASSGGLGGLLGSLSGGSSSAGTNQRGSGGLSDMLGGLLGGGTSGTSKGASSGLGGLLEQLGESGGGTGGLGGLLGGAGAGGLGGLLGGLSGSGGHGGSDLLAGTDETLSKRPERESASFGAVLNSQFDSNPEPEIEPSRDQEAAAAIMLAAMIQAAKSDGQFDDAEREKLLSHLGDVDAQEAAFVQKQMAAPVDVDALVRQTPKGLAPQVYAMSLLGIDLDTQDEAQYLHKLAQGYGMKPAEVNQIHEQMGVPSLYT